MVLKETVDEDIEIKQLKEVWTLGWISEQIGLETSPKELEGWNFKSSHYILTPPGYLLYY